jgi:PAS domain S-box-containing protein
MFFLYRFAQRSVTRTLCVAAEAAAAQQALKDSEGRLSLIIETAYDAYVAMDAGGKIATWNAQAEKTFGWSRKEAIGHLLSERIIPDRFREAFQSGLRRFLETDESSVLSRQVELLAMDRDSREFPIEFTISAIRWGETYLFNAFLRDITAPGYARRQDEMNRQLVETSRQAGKAKSLRECPQRRQRAE